MKNILMRFRWNLLLFLVSLAMFIIGEWWVPMFLAFAAGVFAVALVLMIYHYVTSNILGAVDDFAEIVTNRNIAYAIHQVGIMLLIVGSFGSALWSSLPSNKPKHIIIAESYVGITEKSNRGVAVDLFNMNVGNPLGSEWCSAFVKWCLDMAQIKMPQHITGLARSQVNKDSFTAMDVLNGHKKIKCGYILVWQHGQTIKGHTGFADDDWKGISGKTVEGNASDGVRQLTRRIEPFNYFRIKWVTPVNG